MCGLRPGASSRQRDAIDDFEYRAFGVLQAPLLGARCEGCLALIDIECTACAKKLAQPRGLDFGFPGDIGLGHQRAETEDAFLHFGGGHRRPGKTRHPGQQPRQAGQMHGQRPGAVDQHSRETLQHIGTRHRQHMVDGNETCIAIGSGAARASLSTRVTACPARCRARAVAVPTIPAPTTTMGAVSFMPANYHAVRGCLGRVDSSRQMTIYSPCSNNPMTSLPLSRLACHDHPLGSQGRVRW